MKENSGSGAQDPFWSPFPVLPTIKESNFGATIVDMGSQHKFKVQASAIPDQSKYSMKILGFINPYSQKSEMQFVIKHFPKCIVVEEDLDKPKDQDNLTNTPCYKNENNIRDSGDRKGTKDCLSSPMVWSKIPL